MSAPPEVIAAFDAALPGHSEVEDWYGVGTDDQLWRTTWRGLDVRATPLQAGGWRVNAYLPDSICGHGRARAEDLAAAIRSAVTRAAKVATRYAAGQDLAVMRRMARAAAARAEAAKWGQP